MAGLQHGSIIPATPEAEAGGQVQYLPGVQSEFKASPGKLVRACPKDKK